MKRCALLVGVNEYLVLNGLQYARQDAESFAEMLQRCCGFEEHEITLMTCRTTGGTRANSRFVEHALTDLTERRDLDLLVFGFWGHGFAPEPGKRYLCGIDTLENDLDRTAVPLDIVRAKLAQAGARDTLLVLDCCQNRPAGRGAAAAALERGAEGQLASMARDIQAAQSERGVERIPTVAIMSACREGQRAYEWPDKAHGVFTAHLLEGMTQGVTSVAQLASFVCERTPVTVQKLHRERQVPWFTVEGRGDFVLAAPARTGHIEVLDAPRLHVAAKPAGARVSVDGKYIGQGPVAVELVAGLYTVHVEQEGYAVWERRIRFDGRGDATLEAELVALPPVSEPEAPDSEMPYDDEPVSGYDLDGLHLPPLADFDAEPQTAQGERAPGTETQVDLGNGVMLDLVWCPPGTFLMGSPASEPGRRVNETQHQVTLTQGFWMGKYEVTQEQWERVMGSNPSYFKGDPRLPVETVSWEDCQEFLDKLNGRVSGGGFRLPTEAQWEYACRAGSTTAFNFGNSPDDLYRYSNYCDKSNTDGFYWQDKQHADGHDKMAPVGSLQANAWGLHNMNGKVSEWCADWYGYYASASVTDPAGPSSGEYRVARGGSWDAFPGYCRSAARGYSTPGLRSTVLGLRLSRTP